VVQVELFSTVQKILGPKFTLVCKTGSTCDNLPKQEEFFGESSVFVDSFLLRLLLPTNCKFTSFNWGYVLKKYIYIIFVTLSVIAIGCSSEPAPSTDSGSGVTSMEIDTDAGE
jgi:hypothetical protein